MFFIGYIYEVFYGFFVFFFEFSKVSFENIVIRFGRMSVSSGGFVVGSWGCGSGGGGFSYCGRDLEEIGEGEIKEVICGMMRERW